MELKIDNATTTFKEISDVLGIEEALRIIEGGTGSTTGTILTSNIQGIIPPVDYFMIGIGAIIVIIVVIGLIVIFKSLLT